MSVLIRRAGLFSQKLDEEQGREGEKRSRKVNERTEKANKWGTCTEARGARGSGYTVVLPASVKMSYDNKALQVQSHISSALWLQMSSSTALARGF